MRKAFILSFFILSTLFVGAQPYKTIKKYKPYNWMLGVSWNVIEDDGNQRENLFNVASSWNYLLFPTRVSVDKYLKHGWSAEGSMTYMLYAPGKIVNDTISIGSTFFCFDANAKWSFYNLYAPRMRWVEPYFNLGVGYTYRSTANVAPHLPTLNLGAGLNFWFHKSIGIQFSSTGKLGLWPGFWDSGLHTNYFHHTAGIMVRLHGKEKHKNGDFGKRKHKWAHGNQRYKKKGGH